MCWDSLICQIQHFNMAVQIHQAAVPWQDELMNHEIITFESSPNPWNRPADLRNEKRRELGLARSGIPSEIVSSTGMGKMPFFESWCPRNWYKSKQWINHMWICICCCDPWQQNVVLWRALHGVNLSQLVVMPILIIHDSMIPPMIRHTQRIPHGFQLSPCSHAHYLQETSSRRRQGKLLFFNTRPFCRMGQKKQVKSGFSWTITKIGPV